METTEHNTTRFEVEMAARLLTRLCKAAQVDQVVQHVLPALAVVQLTGGDRAGRGCREAVHRTPG